MVFVLYLHDSLYHISYNNSYCLHKPTTQDSPIEFWNDFLYHLESLNYNRSEALRQAMYVYDAVWTAAFALDNASKQLKNGLLGNVSLEDFDYTRSDINNVLLNSVRSVKFRGVSVSYIR